jgi:hypothetical protein
MNSPYGHGHAAMGGGGGPASERGAQPMNGGEVPGHAGVAPRHASQGSSLARRGIEGVRGGCGSGGPGGGCGTMERAKASWSPGKDLFSSLVPMRTATVSSSSSVSSGGRSKGWPSWATWR